MIDISNETPAALRLAAQFFLDHANLREAMEGAGQIVPTGTPDNVVPFPFPTVHPAMGATAPVAPPAPITNSTAPLAPPAPTMNAPIAPTADTSTTMAPSAPAVASPGVSAAPLADKYDSAGVPFDARIHQKKEGVKKDGTWKLQKGIADSLVSTVMQELAPRIRASAPPAPALGQSPLPAGAAAPVSLPITTVAQANALAPPAPRSVAPSAPPAPAPSGETAPVQAFDPYRALIDKISKARAAKTLTAEEVTQTVAAFGVPNLPALNAMPHLIDSVSANIDAILAMR